MKLVNRLANIFEPRQGEAKRVVCVCRAGLLRSPTAAFVLGNPPFNFNTRSAGFVELVSLVPLDRVLLEWADEVVCVEKEHAEAIRQETKKPVVCLDIPDNYSYRSPELMELIAQKYREMAVWRAAVGSVLCLTSIVTGMAGLHVLGTVMTKWIGE